MIDNERTGRNIMILRLEKGLSQQGLAEVCGVTHQAVSKWENGAALPDIQTMLFLSRFFDTPMEEMLTRELSTEPAEGSASLPPEHGLDPFFLADRHPAQAGSGRDGHRADVGLRFPRLLRHADMVLLLLPPQFTQGGGGRNLYHDSFHRKHVGFPRGHELHLCKDSNPGSCQIHELGRMLRCGRNMAFHEHRLGGKIWILHSKIRRWQMEEGQGDMSN